MDRSLIAAYPQRPPHLAQTFDILLSLIVDVPRTILDAGCGPGNIARPLALRGEHIDAVDIAPGMIELGKTLPGGESPHINWFVGSVEDVSLHPPYALITAGESLHWFDWEIALPRFATLLTPHGLLATIVTREQVPAALQIRIETIKARYSLVRELEDFDLISELERRGLFETIGKCHISCVGVMKSIDEYVESFHALGSFSRDKMSRQAASLFDSEIRDVAAPFLIGPMLPTSVDTMIVWGRPHPR